MNLDIIGNIKINEKDPDRIKYLFACIKSYAFLKDECKFILNLEGASDRLFNLVQFTLEKIGFKKVCLYRFEKSLHTEISYGKIFLRLMEDSQADYHIFFQEDQFMLCDDVQSIYGLIMQSGRRDIDIIKASFYRIEKNSSLALLDVSLMDTGLYFDCNIRSFPLYCKFYGSRYFLGVNAIWNKKFALKFWSRPIDSKRPHEYEIINYDENFKHNVMIPNFEIQCAVDDNHGEERTCLLDRNQEKWNKIFDEL